MPKAFISYARDGGYGENLAAEIQQQLQAAGFAVFRDVIGLKPGDVWFHKLDAELESSDVMVLVLSEKVRTSVWVPNEVDAAKELGIPIIPVLAEKMLRPIWIRHLQVLDFCGVVDWALLFGAIGHHVDGRPSPPSPLSRQAVEGEQDVLSLSPSTSGRGVGVREIPVWASDAGQDQYGRYADLVVKGVTQKFRWIEPGTFWMGSPDSEKGRYDREVRHQVTLTKGFWLGDTACTQALWKLVLEDNPANFQDNGNNPVERVSWNGVQEFFLQRLNRMVSGLNARLPTEAEWEYACRAGTTTSFNFVGEVSLAKVNYRGTWDGHSKWGEGALKKTAPVKSYSPNSWGLYEMHGNVWEWCQDAWQEKLSAEPVIDPDGAGGDTGRRVIRGGSWISDGGLCRSAYRRGFVPDGRDFDVGFRLALGL